MKKIVSILLSGIIILAGCSEPKQLDMAQVHQFEDSIPKIITTASTVQTRVDQNTELKVIVGDVTFYNAPDAAKQAKAKDVGMLALRIFGKDLTKGRLIITKDLQNHPEDPTDGISTDMHIAELKGGTK